jgi:hypothetical protein
MKKIITMLVATVVATTTMVGVSANNLPEPVYENKEMDTDNPKANVPVFGYIGPDANITDPSDPIDVTDPTIPPTVTPIATDMEVSLPVRLMWAAFASDGGQIKSPTYSIENKSAFAVDVELTSFNNTTAEANPAMDAGIVISLTDLNPSATNVVGMTTALPVGTLSAANSTGSSTQFSIGGSYTGSFSTQYLPTYSMVLTFSIH